MCKSIVKIEVTIQKLVLEYFEANSAHYYRKIRLFLYLWMYTKTVEGLHPSLCHSTNLEGTSRGEKLVWSLFSVLDLFSEMELTPFWKSACVVRPKTGRANEVRTKEIRFFPPF